MNHFKNSYYIMRHGESIANVAGLIISNPQVGSNQFGLSRVGKQQVKKAITEIQEPVFTHIICSDFLRAKETANIAAQLLDLAAPQVELDLRERDFGQWEGQPDVGYQQVWRQDEFDDKHVSWNVESPFSVQKRGILLLSRLEQKYNKKCLLLISHGDLLQILRTAFMDLSAGKHRQLPHHETAEIKLLVGQGFPKPDGWPQ